MTAFIVPPPWKLPEHETTSEAVYADRRQVLRALGLGMLGLALPAGAATEGAPDEAALTRPSLGERFADRFPAMRNDAYGLGARKLTDERVAARYNNFYEFTTDKDRVWQLAQGYPVDPWRIEIDGLVAKKKTLDLETLFTRFPLEERLYRFRCVERWAMQVPWTGFPLKALIDYCEPLPSAKYVAFISVLDRPGLPGQESQPWYSWPFFEGLRLDEARHPLAFAALGIYGHALPIQHGAPWRLVMPWKYGYKSPKSIVRIELTRKQPGTFWNELQPAEYGFYSNVDPSKPHPRWSQAHETDIGTQETRPTLPYNGYADEVSGLYTGKEV